MKVNYTLIDSITFLVISTLDMAGHWEDKDNEIAYTNSKFVWRFRFYDNYADSLPGSRRQRLFNFIQLVIDEVKAQDPSNEELDEWICKECVTLEILIRKLINEEAWSSRCNVPRIRDGFNDWLHTLGNL
jgi:hypothetical protein